MRRIWIPQTVCGVLVVWAMYPGNPYGYYVFLRIVCFIVLGYLGWVAMQTGKHGWSWVFIAGSILYNPIFPIHLNRLIWAVINVLTLIVLAASATQLSRNPSQTRVR